MKKENKQLVRGRSQKVVKGKSSAVLFSSLIHVGLISLAAVLVVIEITTKKDPPPINILPERKPPKMDIVKPRPSKPTNTRPQSTQKIAIDNDKVGTPDLVVPELSDKFMEVTFDPVVFEVPEPGDISNFGTVFSSGSDLEGTFYDMKRRRSGAKTSMDPSAFAAEIRKFMKGGWNAHALSKYWKSPNKRHASTFMVPPMNSCEAPDAFKEYDVQGYCWAMLYKGDLAYPEDITFRFWGVGDDIIAVRVGEEVKFLSTWVHAPQNDLYNATADIWQSNDPVTATYRCGNMQLVVGDWITLRKDESVPIEVLFGEANGGIFTAMLMVEVQGAEYERNQFGAPILPVFKTEELSLGKMDLLVKELAEGEADVFSGPVFNDYSDAATNAVAQVETNNVEEVAADTEIPEFRTWTTAAGETFDAKYINLMARDVVIQNQTGRQVKVPFSDLSVEDQLFVELSNPPILDINFKKRSSQRSLKPVSPYVPGFQRRLTVQDYEFGVRVSQRGPGDYNHPLHVELLVVGEEIFGGKYILLDRLKSGFELNDENGRMFELYGDRQVTFRKTALFSNDDVRGERYSGYVAVVRDSRGKIVAEAASADFLQEKMEEIKKLATGSYFDRSGKRSRPTALTQRHRPNWDWL